MAEGKKLVDCYGCFGQEMCEFPELGCTLCETYGDGDGLLDEEYRYKEVVIDGVTYTPPRYKCLVCKDRKTCKRRVWDNRLVDPCFSDHGEHNMPKVQVPCWKCCPEESEKEFRRLEKEILSKPVAKDQ